MAQSTTMVSPTVAPPNYSCPLATQTTTCRPTKFLKKTCYTTPNHVNRIYELLHQTTTTAVQPETTETATTALLTLNTTETEGLPQDLEVNEASNSIPTMLNNKESLSQAC
jgi:hypothetical protein